MLIRNSLITDSGFWIALLNRCDPYHRQAVVVLDQYCDDLLLVTWPVLVETGHLLLKRAGFQAQMTFLATVQQGGADVFHLHSADYLTRMCALMRKYRGLPMDLADASLVILAEELGHGRILSTDQRDFQTYRWKNHHPFENLLIPA